MMYTLLCMTLLATSTSGELWGKIWKKDVDSKKTKVEFEKFMDDQKWCSAEACHEATGEVQGRSWFFSRTLKAWSNQYGFTSEGCKKYLEAANAAPKVGADRWREKYEYDAVGETSDPQKVRDLLALWELENPSTADKDKIKAAKTYMSMPELIGAYFSWFGKKVNPFVKDAIHQDESDAPIGIMVISALLFYGLYWLPGLWYSATVAAVGGAAIVYSGTSAASMVSRIRSNETELLTQWDYIETIGIAGCVGVSVMVWSCSELARSGFGFFPGSLDWISKLFTGG